MNNHYFSFIEKNVQTVEESEIKVYVDLLKKNYGWDMEGLHFDSKEDIIRKLEIIQAYSEKNALINEERAPVVNTTIIFSSFLDTKTSFSTPTK